MINFKQTLDLEKHLSNYDLRHSNVTISAIYLGTCDLLPREEQLFSFRVESISERVKYNFDRVASCDGVLVSLNIL